MIKRFIIKTAVFVFALIILFFSILWLLPATPAAKTSFLSAETKKDSLMIHVPSPRIIFIGGSNLSFGLNSEVIKDSLGLNPINTSIGIALGLKYMLDHNLQYVRTGDVIVLVPEYQHFFWDYDYGSKEILGIALDVNRSNIRLLNLKQIMNSLKSSGKFIFSKLNLKEYQDVNIEEDIYGISAYNQFGDACRHWTMEKREVTPFKKIDPGTYNPQVIERLKEYEQLICRKGAVLLIAYPGVQDISFEQSKAAIEKVKEELAKNGFEVLGTPERYEMLDSLLFEAPYHLNKKGVDYRTQLFIEDMIQVQKTDDQEYHKSKSKNLKHIINKNHAV